MPICRVPSRLVFDSAILFLNSFSEKNFPTSPHSLETDLYVRYSINVVGGGGGGGGVQGWRHYTVYMYASNGGLYTHSYDSWRLKCEL